MTELSGRTAFVLAIALCAVSSLAAEPGTQPTSTRRMDAVSQPANPEQLQQARVVFSSYMSSSLTDADRVRVEKLIAQLASDHWRQREAAEKALKNEPIIALPLIVKAAESNDFEVAIRARNVVEALQKNSASLQWAITTRQEAGDTTMIGDLIALLSSDDASVRYTAQSALAKLTGQDFGYYADDEADKREPAVLKARQWWDKNKGDFRFTDQNMSADLNLGNGIHMELTCIFAGKFMMGSSSEEQAHHPSEEPQHEVTISRAFYIGTFEVTEEQYAQVMGNSPSSKGPKNPVESVSWNDAVEFCNKLSKSSGKTVRLPTEAQWEYACRAGTQTRFSFGNSEKELDEYVWHSGNCNGGTHPVGQKKANAWGLYDMHGNVWEWCSDWRTDSYRSDDQPDKVTITDPTGPATGSSRILRGGSWCSGMSRCRSAHRNGDDPNIRRDGYGFRVIVEIPARSSGSNQETPASATAP